VNKDSEPVIIVEGVLEGPSVVAFVAELVATLVVGVEKSAVKSALRIEMVEADAVAVVFAMPALTRKKRH